MEDNSQQPTPITSPVQEPEQKRNILKNKLLLILPLGILFILFLSFVYVLGTKNVTKVPAELTKTASQTSRAAQESYSTYRDEAGTYSLKIPKEFIPNVQASERTDSCVVVADYTFVQPGASEEEMAALRKKSVLISVCYTAKNLGIITDKLATLESAYSVTSSTPTKINGYDAFKVDAKSSYETVNDMVVIKSPYQGYVVMSREDNGKEVYDNMVSSFNFIKPRSTIFTTADEEVITKLFADQYKKDITVTFNHPSPDQDSISGDAYLPGGSKCFNADRNSGKWTISYTGSSITDSKCYNF